MSYDFEGVSDLRAPEAKPSSTQPRDLEAIVTLLEVAAIELTSEPGAEFTEDELIRQARDIGGDLAIEESDAKIVLDKAAFLKKLKGKRFRLK